MIRSRSALVRFGAFAVLALLLSACIKLDMNLTVNSDDTVDGTVIFALNKQLIQLSGQSADDLLGSSGPIPTDAPGVSTKPYEDDEFQGQEITLDNVPLARFNDENNSGADSLKIVHQGDTYVVSGALDLSQTSGASGASGASGVSGFPDAEQIFASAQMKLAITFPGEVTESNGQVDGNTVTWEPKFGERLDLHAVAKASGGGGSSTLLLLLVVGAIVVILAIVLGILATRRKNAQRTEATDGTAPALGTPGVATSPPPAGGAKAAPGGSAPASGGAAPPPPPPPPPSEPQP
jgi:hypothetical protein